MKYRDAQQARWALHAVATTQGGYFTARQAHEAGYGNRHLDYHTGTRNFERVSRGLYRLPTIPLDEQDELIRLSLWSRDRRDQPQAVASHDTALAFHQLSDVLPVRLHLTVPPSFRKPLPSVTVVLHKAVLATNEVQEAAGFRVTIPGRTLLDIAGEPSFSREQLDKALAGTVERGLVQRSWLRAMSRHFPRIWRALRGKEHARKLRTDMAGTFSNVLAFKASLEDWLKRVAAERGVTVNALRLKLVIERLLARLLQILGQHSCSKEGIRNHLFCVLRASVDLEMRRWRREIQIWYALKRHLVDEAVINFIQQRTRAFSA